MLFTVSLALLADTVPRNEIGKWLGVVLSCNNIGMVLSPLFGGVIYDAAGNYGVVTATMALISLDMLLRLFMTVKPRQATTQSMSSLDTSESKDTNSSATSLWSTNEEATIPTSQTTRRSGILRLIRSPRLLAALYGIFLNECLDTSLTAVLPLFLERIFGWNPLGAGLIFLTIAIPSIGGFAFGWLSDRFGPKPIATVGMLIAGPTVVLLGLVKHDGMQQIVLLCALLTTIGTSILLFSAIFSKMY